MLNSLLVIFVLGFSSTANAQDDTELDRSEVRPPIGWGVPSEVTPLWSGTRGTLPEDGQISCEEGEIPLVAGTSDQINGGIEAQYKLDWGRAWSVQPPGWNGDWAQALVTVTGGERENAAAIWCVEPEAIIPASGFSSQPPAQNWPVAAAEPTIVREVEIRTEIVQISLPSTEETVDSLDQQPSPPSQQCEWDVGLHAGASASLQGFNSVVAGDVWIPVVGKKSGNCSSVHLSAGGGITPARDGVSPLDAAQFGGGVASSYSASAGYAWGKNLRSFELGGAMTAMRIHPSGTPDLYQAGPRAVWTPHFGAVQLEVWGSPGLMWGYAEAGSAGWSGAFGQPAAGAGHRFQPTIAAGINVGFRL